MESASLETAPTKSKSDIWLTAHAASGAVRMLVQLASMMILLPIIIQHTSEEKYGIWTLAMAIAGILAFLELGLVQATNRFLSPLDHTREPEAFRDMACTSFWLTVLSGLFVLVIGIPFAQEIAELLGIPTELQGEAGVVVSLFIWRLAISVPLRNFNAVLISQRLMIRAHITQSVVSIAYLGASWGVLVLGGGLIELSLVYLAAMVLENLIYLLLARPVIPLSAYSPKRFKAKLVPNILEFSVFALLGQIVNVVFLRAGVLLVQVTSGLVATGAYGIAMRLTSISAELASQVTFAGGPKLSKLAFHSEEGRREAGWLALSMSRRAILLSGPLAAIAIPLGGIFLKGWIGGEMAPMAAMPLIFSSLDVAIGAPVMTAMNALALTGEHRWSNLVSIVMIILYLPAAYVAGIQAGPTGVAAASLAITIFVSVPLFLPRLSKHLGIHLFFWWSEVYKNHLIPFFFCLASSFGFALLIETNIPEGRIWLFASAVAGLIAGIVYFVIYGAWTAPAEERERIAHFVKKLGSRMKPGKA